MVIECLLEVIQDFVCGAKVAVTNSNAHLIIQLTGYVQTLDSREEESEREREQKRKVCESRWNR